MSAAASHPETASSQWSVLEQNLTLVSRLAHINAPSEIPFELLDLERPRQETELEGVWSRFEEWARKYRRTITLSDRLNTELFQGVPQSRKSLSEATVSTGQLLDRLRTALRES